MVRLRQLEIGVASMEGLLDGPTATGMFALPLNECTGMLTLSVRSLARVAERPLTEGLLANKLGLNLCWLELEDSPPAMESEVQLLWLAHGDCAPEMVRGMLDDNDFAETADDSTLAC